MTKKFILSIASLCLLSQVQAKEVSSTMASAKAQEIMTQVASNFQGKVASVSPVSYQGQKAYYVVQFVPQGWALISADDTTEPLIGYNTDGKYETNNQPESMVALLDCFSKKIVDRKRALVNQVAGWDAGSKLYAKSITRAGKEDIEPLIQVKWNQSGSYKKYCPKNSSGQAIVGCVAVAMAQAMSVAQWPMRPVGEYSYNDPTYGVQYINYDNEPAYNWKAILSGANGNDDVARLLWHCGVSVNMKYGTDGSGTQDYYIATALQRNFSYPKSAKYVKRSTYDGDWDALVYQELSEGRAVCLSGQDLKGGYGHCFNLDGYAGGAYHVNWGWGGQNNGYFMLNGLKDATMNMDYSDPAYQSLIIGIRRPSDKPSDILISNLTVQAGQPAGTVVGTFEVENEAAVPPTYTYKFQGAYNVVTHRYGKAPFTVVDGNLVTTDVLEAKSYSLTITATDQNGNSITRTFTIKAVASTGISDVSQNAKEASVCYYNLQGLQIDKPEKGINLIEYRYADGHRKVVKQIVK